MRAIIGLYFTLFDLNFQVDQRLENQEPDMAARMTLRAKIAAVSARKICEPNETGRAISRSAESSSGVKSPSGPM